MIRIRLVTYLISFFPGGGGQRRWQWFNMKPMLNYCILFAGNVFS